MRPGTQPPSQAGALFLDNAVGILRPRAVAGGGTKSPGANRGKEYTWRRDFSAARAAYHAWRSLAVGPEKR